jgi:hypothetical protein
VPLTSFGQGAHETGEIKAQDYAGNQLRGRTGELARPSLNIKGVWREIMCNWQFRFHPFVLRRQSQHRPVFPRAMRGAPNCPTLISFIGPRDSRL